MLELFILAVPCILIISFCGEPTQSLVVYEDAKRIDSQDGDIDAQVEFEVVDEEGIVDVVTHDQRRVLLKLAQDGAQLRGYGNALPLRPIVRLHDIGDSR